MQAGTFGRFKTSVSVSSTVFNSAQSLGPEVCLDLASGSSVISGHLH